MLYGAGITCRVHNLSCTRHAGKMPTLPPVFLSTTPRLLVALLANIKGQISVLDHVLNLLLHGEREENKKVNEQNGPKDGDVKGGNEATQQRDGGGACCRMPKLELWQSSDKGLELVRALGLLCGQLALLGVLHLHVALERGVELGLQKGEEQIEQVDSKRVADHVPALGGDDSDHEHRQQHAKRHPSVELVGHGAVHVVLVNLQHAPELGRDGIQRRRSWLVHVLLSVVVMNLKVG